MHVRNLEYPFPLQIGAQKRPFGRFRNLKTTLTVYDVHKRASVSGQMLGKLQGICYIVSKQHELWSTNGFKLDRSFYPVSVNSTFHFIARLRWRSANGTQPHFVKRWIV